MTLNQLIYFQTIAKLSHFRQAAAKLNLSQPSLSRSISALEEELGIILFERQGRNVRLTKYGRIFLEHVDKILQDVETAKSQMRQLAGGEGRVDIAYVFPVAGRYIPHMAPRFLSQRSYQNISFGFHQLHTDALIEGLKKERFDLIFCSYVENEPDIQFIPIIRQKMVVIAPQGHPITQKENLILPDLNDYPLIGYDKTSGLGKFTNRLYASHHVTPDIICESPDENGISALVEENFGIALVADVDAIRERNDQILSLSDVTLVHTVYLAHMKDRYLIPAVKNFIQFIRKESMP